MKKRAIFILCVLALCLSLLTAGALAADDVWTYAEDSGNSYTYSPATATGL